MRTALRQIDPKVPTYPLPPFPSGQQHHMSNSSISCPRTLFHHFSQDHPATSTASGTPLKSTLVKPLPHPNGIRWKHLLNHFKIPFEVALKSFWNPFAILLKFVWNPYKFPMKTILNHWKTYGIPLKHFLNPCQILFEIQLKSFVDLVKTPLKNILWKHP